MDDNTPKQKGEQSSPKKTVLEIIKETPGAQSTAKFCWLCGPCGYVNSGTGKNWDQCGLCHKRTITETQREQVKKEREAAAPPKSNVPKEVQQAADRVTSGDSSSGSTQQNIGKMTEASQKRLEELRTALKICNYIVLT